MVARECLIAYLILLAFRFGGRKFLDVMHPSESSLSIAGSVILFMIGINMVFKTKRKTKGVRKKGVRVIILTFSKTIHHDPFYRRRYKRH